MQQLVPDSLNISTQNVADCLKQIYNIGSTTHVNVCSGAEWGVPWGTMDWFGWGMVGILVLGVLLVCLLAVWAAWH